MSTNFSTKGSKIMTYEEYSVIRDSLNLKDGTVAARAGITRSTFTDWKSGRSKPKQEKMEKIMAALNQPPAHKQTITNVFNPNNAYGTGKSDIFPLKEKENNDNKLEVLKADELFAGMAKMVMELYEPRDQEEINYMLKQFSSYARASQKTRQIIDGILKMEEEEN